ncbi:MAG: thioredoxin family protein [Acidobacteria bacterium]|nr:thioredoxin family protein [Acidobacteriota bacterium]
MPKMPKFNETGERSKTPRLQVYVASHCLNCAEARRLAQVAAQTFSDLVVEVIDLDQTPALSADVFAVPTYVLNNRVCFLGNPSQEELFDLLRQQIRSENNP